MLFKHFLATRFNLRIGNWETTKNGEELLSKGWMEDRFRLFESYCLPSVLHQSSKNFTWCIFFDTNTLEEDRNKIKVLTEAHKHIAVLFINSVDELKSALIGYIQSSAGHADYIITTRLDTDDLLHTDYIEIVQELFVPQHDTVIDIRSGYQVSMEDTFTEVKNFNNSFNQFISLVEESHKVETIFSKWHKHWENWKNVVVYDQKRLWIEMVHGKNFVNGKRPGLGYPSNFSEANFGIRGKISLKKDRSYYTYFFKNGMHYGERYLKSIIKRGLKSTIGFKQK